MKNHPPSTAEMLHLIGLIYASATDASKTAEALRVFNEQLGGRASQIFTRHLATGAVLHSQISVTDAQDAHQAYVGHWGPLDPRVELMASLPPGQVLRCHEHFDPKFVAGSSFYQEFLIPHGLRWAIGGMYLSGPGTATVVAVVRTPESPAFEDWAAATLGQLLPHFERASVIGSNLARRTAAVHSATDILKLLPTPCLLTDEAGRCIEGNNAFTKALAALSLRVVTGRARFSHPHVQSRWERALFETHSTALEQTMVVNAAGGRQWKVHLIPLEPMSSHPGGFDSSRILVVFDEKVLEARPQSGPACAKVRLTRAEVEVLAGLLKGLPAKAIATRRSASVHTVRSQIMAILEKTGYNSQKQLIASFGSTVLPSSAFSNSAFAPPNA